MTVQDVIEILEELAPLSYAKDFDNTGLLVGQPQTKLNGILVALDTLETVVDEAIENNCNLIVSFHPIIFKGLKSITGKNYVERTVLKAIQHDIAIFSMHTALDNAWNGVNAAICDKLQFFADIIANTACAKHFNFATLAEFSVGKITEVISVLRNFKVP